MKNLLKLGVPALVAVLLAFTALGMTTPVSADNTGTLSIGTSDINSQAYGPQSAGGTVCNYPNGAYSNGNHMYGYDDEGTTGRGYGSGMMGSGYGTYHGGGMMGGR